MQVLLKERRSLPELMDAPDVRAAEHRAALAGLERINRVSGTVARMARPIRAWARQVKGGPGQVRMLDVACGGGDVPVGVARALSPLQVSLTVTDRSATALGQAMELARRQGVNCTGMAGEAPAALPEGPFDVVTNSLFLHHLDRRDVVQTLRALAKKLRPGGLLVISDLRRSPLGWLVAWVGCRVLSRSTIVHHDGPVSVAAAWSMGELREMAEEAGLAGAVLRRAWPWRMLLVWQKRGEKPA